MVLIWPSCNKKKTVEIYVIKIKVRHKSRGWRNTQFSYPKLLQFQDLELCLSLLCKKMLWYPSTACLFSDRLIVQPNTCCRHCVACAFWLQKLHGLYTSLELESQDFSGVSVCVPLPQEVRRWGNASTQEEVCVLVLTGIRAWMKRICLQFQ